MTELLSILTTIALLDSTSIVPVAMVPLVTMLSSKRPLLSSLSFVAGLFVTYYVCALLAYTGLDSLFDAVNVWFRQWMKNPDTPDLYLQIVLGILMVISAVLMCRPGHKKAAQREPKSVSPVGVFLFGGFLILIGMPGALPMFAAIDQILRADLTFASAAVALLYYVFVFVLPLLAIVFVRIVAGDKSTPVFNAINRFLEVWGKRMVVIVLFVLGFALLADGIGWLLGRSFIPID